MSRADEVPVPGPVPLWEVPGWRDRFGVVAGITGRGDSQAEPFDLGLWNKQPIGQTMSRWRSFRAALPEFPSAVLAHQVHGSKVLWHEQLPIGWTILEGADGHATATPGQLMLITVADCVPIYLIDPMSRSVALVHAGWRGTAAGVLANAVAMLKSFVSARSHDIVMHCGIAISGKCYEVGNEVLTAVGKPTSVSGHSHLDLRSVLVEQGHKLGIVDITSSDLCTASRRDLFFSHRGSAGADGRMVAYLGLLVAGG